MKKIKVMGVVGGLVAILILFGMLFKAHEYQDNRYASQTVLAQTQNTIAQIDKKVEEDKKDLAIHKLQVYLKELQQHIWNLEDRLDKKPSDTTAKKELREYKDLKVKTEDQIKDMKK